MVAAVLKCMDAGRPVRVRIHKARQLGVSTLVQALAFARTARHRGVQARLIAHQDDSTQEIYSKHGIFVDHLPGAAEALERFARVDGPLRWRHQSALFCATAGGKGIGHGGTLQFLHLSEVSRYGVSQTTPLQRQRVIDLAVGVRASLPNDPDTFEFDESTANGYGDHWHRAWLAAVAGEDGFEPVFIAWWEDPSYVMQAGTAGLNTAADYDEDERDLAGRFGLTLEQLCWRRFTIANTCAGDVAKFREQYPSTPDEAFLVSGRTVFDPELLREYLRRVAPPVWRGDFHLDEPAGWVPEARSDGPVLLWELPRDGERYVVGADTADCETEQSDRSAAVIRNARTLAIAGVLVGRFEPGTFARKLAAIGWYYNEALVCPEADPRGKAVIGALRGRLGGPPMYRRIARFKRVDALTGQPRVDYGFRTDHASKRVAVEAEQRLLREHVEVCPSAEILEEARAFLELGHGRMGAAPGGHDDLVIAWVISAYLAAVYAVSEPSPAEQAQAKVDRILELVDRGDPEAELDPFIK